MTIGFRICTRERCISASLIERFRVLPVANVSDMMNRMSAAGARLRPMHAGGVMTGPALTVKTRPGDNLMIHKALDLAQPGDVVVVDAGGDLTNALFGELMLAYATTRSVAGVVMDGAIRDADVIAGQPLPVFAAGVTHRGPYKDGPGEINVPVAVDGMVIEPGDLVLGDGDGVLSVPFEHAESVCLAAEAKRASEQVSVKAIASGSWDRRWVDETLERLGCELP